MLLREIRSIFHSELDAIYGVQETDSFFYLLIEHYLGLERFILALKPNYTLTKDEEKPLFEALAALKKEMPIQYILGSTQFMDRTFKVAPGILIPRPETEDLVRWVIADSDQNKKILEVLDMGTGSGCIAITLAKNLTNLKVSALDVSEKTLAIAQQNAIDNEANVKFYKADMLDENDLPVQQWDILVSNPPYVRQMEKEGMANNVKLYEPELALFVPNEAPLIFYERIVQYAKDQLRPHGRVYLEINQFLVKETMALFASEYFSSVVVKKDLFGNDRMIKAIKA